MPPLKDLLEIMFMGPGLVCLVVVLLGGALSLARRIRTHRAEVMARLTNEATKLYADGKMQEAKAKAEEAVALAHPRHPRNTGRAHFCLGRVHARLGELDEAETHLAKAMELDADPHRRALAAANLSMVLTRLGRAEDAFARACEAVKVHDETKEYPERFMRVGAGWANVALSLALTDTGKDGLPAAMKALATFDDLDVADGLAHAHLAKAHALKTRDPKAAFAAASEAHSRFSRLHAANPGLYGDRFEDTQKLLDFLSDAVW